MGDHRLAALQRLPTRGFLAQTLAQMLPGDGEASRASQSVRGPASARRERARPLAAGAAAAGPAVGGAAAGAACPAWLRAPVMELRNDPSPSPPCRAGALGASRAGAPAGAPGGARGPSPSPRPPLGSCASSSSKPSRAPGATSLVSRRSCSSSALPPPRRGRDWMAAGRCACRRSLGAASHCMPCLSCSGGALTLLRRVEARTHPFLASKVT